MKRKIRGKIWLLIAGALAVGMLTGCGGTGDQDEFDENVVEETAGALGEDEQTENNGKGLGDRERESQGESTEEGDGMETVESDKPITMADLLNESGNMHGVEDVSSLPETILWFNATYATLTYSNGCNWRIVGGLEPTEDNADLTKALLLSGWNVLTREDALDTVERLTEEGHRGKCRECHRLRQGQSRPCARRKKPQLRRNLFSHRRHCHFARRRSGPDCSLQHELGQPLHHCLPLKYAGDWQRRRSRHRPRQSGAGCNLLRRCLPRRALQRTGDTSSPEPND